MKKFFVLAAGKLQDKKKDDDPEYLQRADLLRVIQTQLREVMSAIDSWSNSLYAMSGANFALSKKWCEIIDPTEETMRGFAAKSQEGIEAMYGCWTNIHDAHVPSVIIKPLIDLKAKISALKKAKKERKKYQIFLRSEEKALKQAQEKAGRGDLKDKDREKAEKDAEKRVEKHKNAKAEFDKWNNEFLTGVDELENQRNDAIKVAFQGYQFYMMELVELQQAAIIEQNSDFPMEDLRSTFPSATSKDVPVVIQPAEELHDDQSDDVSD